MEAPLFLRDKGHLMVPGMSQQVEAVEDVG